MRFWRRKRSDQKRRLGLKSRRRWGLSLVIVEEMMGMKAEREKKATSKKAKTKMSR